MRRRDREVTELNEIIHILDSGKVLHLGLVDQGKPYIVPVNYGYVMENDKLVFYVHGALEGRKLDIIRNNSDCCVQIECDVQPFSGKVAHFSQTNMISRNTKIIGFLQMKMRKTDTK